MVSRLGLWINGRYVFISSKFTVWQACMAWGERIPCFCFHENLCVAGNCRVCLVEILGTIKLLVSCSLLVIRFMKIRTKGFRVSRVREAIIELLLINHPLDCPICDQSSECDLQDVTMLFGSMRGRFYEVLKTVVRDFDYSPCIRTILSRCIACSRCVRYSLEFIGMLGFGMLGRGNDMEVGDYLVTVMDDELSGNIIDLCPVGILSLGVS